MYPEEYPQLFVRSDSSIYQIHFYDDSYVELEKAKDYQHPSPSQINSAPRVRSANKDTDDSSVDGPPELISSSADDGAGDYLIRRRT